MSRINDSATKVGTLAYADGGADISIWAGINKNTGEDIVWVKPADGRAVRVTGRNIAKLAADIDATLREGIANWKGEVNTAALLTLSKNAA